MSGVVLRCPNCGTVQPEDGECEACREAQVRYFCTSHTPGLWLDSEACAQCGARFGDPAPAREPPPAPPPRTDYRPSGVSELEPDLGRRDPRPWGLEESPGGGLDAGGLGGGGRERPDPTRLLLALFGAAARARRPRADPYSGDYAPRRRRGGGCLGRLLMLAVLLFLLFLMVPVFLGALLNFG
jgi:hypothetical protein